jgi:flagellar protein FlbT
MEVLTLLAPNYRLSEESKMPLRFDLGPFEKLFIGKSILTNGSGRIDFVVEGETPILRGRDVLSAEQAISNVQKLYRCVQQIYLEENLAKYRDSFLSLSARATSDCPAHHAEIKAADRLIKNGQPYKALKELKKIAFQSGRKVEAPIPRFVY